ncbi:MAG: PorV/PorQ family protein, partial [Longimicrobiales bacterium]
LAAVSGLFNVQAANAQGAGTTGAQVLQFVAGSRAVALSGAYTAVSSDADVLFYNPAGIVPLRHAAALSYEAYVEGVALASFGGVLNLGRITLGISELLLDAGDVNERVPDPDFGGNRGISTGRVLSASESVTRISAAAPFGDRLRLGASAGVIATTIAEQGMNAPVFDLGAQYELSRATLGVALRNVGTDLSGDNLRPAKPPTEARLGAVMEFQRADGFGFAIHTDIVSRLHEGSTGLVVGAEGGWQAQARALTAMARVGYSAAEGAGGLGAIKFGGGLTMGQIALDYAFQHMEFLGAVHRLGLRWSVPR